MIYLKPDLHMHSTFSDGSDTPEELLENVRSAGLDLFALTDHDTMDGCIKVLDLLGPNDPRFIPGIELSCRDDCGKYHVLGYGYDANKSSINLAVDFAHDIRLRKLENRFHYLEEQCGFNFTEEEKQSIINLKNPGKPHFAMLLFKKGLVKTKDEGFELISKYRGKEGYLTPEQAIDAILKSNGVPVLAHGILADGSKSLGDIEIEERVARLKASGLMGLECYYSRFNQKQQETMLKLADKYNLLVTAGSDYHGTNKNVQLGKTNNPDPNRMKRFYSVIDYLL